jgi:hypothetical protein
MPKAHARAEQLVPAAAGAGAAGARDEVVDAVAYDLRRAAADTAAVGFVERYVDVPCPSGKHQRSMLTFRSHRVAAMFCIPCQKGWTEPVTHRALRDLAVDSPR